MPLLAFVPLLAQAAVLLVGGWMVSRGGSAVGEFFAFNLYVTMLVLPLRMLGMWIGQAQRATASGERIFEVLDEPEEVADAPGARELPPGGRPHPVRARRRSATRRRAGARGRSTSRSHPGGRWR